MSVTFNPGIWRITGTRGSTTDYELVQSNNVTYNPYGNISNIHPCQTIMLSEMDQFTAPAGSVIGLYTNYATQLLRTNTNNSIRTYRFSANQSNITTFADCNVNYNIAIEVHLGR